MLGISGPLGVEGKIGNWCGYISGLSYLLNCLFYLLGRSCSEVNWCRAMFNKVFDCFEAYLGRLVASYGQDDLFIEVRDVMVGTKVDTMAKHGQFSN